LSGRIVAEVSLDRLACPHLRNGEGDLERARIGGALLDIGQQVVEFGVSRNARVDDAVALGRTFS
jgi:hypothetical protein